MRFILAVLALAAASGAWADERELRINACKRIDLTLTAAGVTDRSGPSYYSSVTASSGAVVGGPQRRNTTKPRILLGDSVALNWTSNGSSRSRLTLTKVGTVGTSGSAQVAPSSVGDHAYTLTATDECGERGSVSVTVTVHRTRVFLMGSRYSSAPTVLDYMLTPGAWCSDCFGAGINAFEDFAKAGVDKRQSRSGEVVGYSGQALTRDLSRKTEGFAEFADEVRSWPRSVEAYQRAHVGGNTYVVDERGKVLGSVPTLSLYDTGIPGLSYAGDPSGYGGRNRLWVGSGDLKWEGKDYEVVGLMAASPIVLDLDGNGKPDVDRGEWLPHPNRFNRSRAVLFDITATGFPNLTEWVGPKDGLLLAPGKAGARVVAGSRLFGNPIGYVDGYQKLGLLYDKDGDGAVRGEELRELLVWRDANSNARLDPGEARPAGALGITRIATKHHNLKSTFTLGGEERSTWDWWPTSMIVYPKPVAGLTKP